ncbi:MAG: tungsten formylmethanofuran dehydrogenase [Bacteroidota bacterium]|nr:tungsten formylmethanofuran dehydrogenase [Bacteroidota bacterium]MDX5431156.1 tungsten formylmethanofuran dehydrogenase [Bacteroidota bacterium]
MVNKETLLKVYGLMCQARAMADIYDANRQITKYVHSTSKGHEAIQMAAGLLLKACDYAAPYYRDEAMLLAMGMTPYELMLQLLAKKDDPFSGGRTYYAHPSLNRPNMPKMPHQSSATGMQGIPATGMAHGVAYLEGQKLLEGVDRPVVLCSFGDGSVTEGEVAEAFQMAVLHDLPIVYLVQDNEWGISATGKEMRAMDAYEYAAGFKGMKRTRVDGTDFIASYEEMEKAIEYVRSKRKPILVHATVPLLGHHTSGVRKEFYRTDDDLAKHAQTDPYPALKKVLLDLGVEESELSTMEEEARVFIADSFERAKNAEEPEAASLTDHEFAPTPITEEQGERAPAGKEAVIMVDAALFAMDEILKNHPEALLYGQDVGSRLGGVFREAATLGKKYGDDRVFNTPIQEAYIIGSTAGFSAVGCKPIVEIQFADYIWPGVNQLVTELSKSCYLSNGKYPVQALIRVPTGAYGGGGPYHSGTVESSILQIKGIKVVYPSNAADMKGLMKAAFHDPNPVVMFEHKGLYWSKVPGTEAAKTIEPSEDYIIPLGKARVVLEADNEMVENGESVAVITYGMGVYWALAAEKNLPGQVEILDLRTLNPCDDEAIYAQARKHGKMLVLTEETLRNSFAEAIAGRVARECFQSLDAPVQTMGSVNIPAVPLNMGLEKEMLPNGDKLTEKLRELLLY